MLKQTKARVLEGNQHYGDKLYSVFEVHTEAIRKGKLSSLRSLASLLRSRRRSIGLLRTMKFF